MDEVGAVLQSFGDDHRQSTLLDQFERLSFEIQLSQAMLKRSLSEPSGILSTGVVPQRQQQQQQQQQQKLRRRHVPLMMKEVSQGKNGSGAFHKIIKRLLSPFFKRGRGKILREGTMGLRGDPETVVYSRKLSKSVRT